MGRNKLETLESLKEYCFRALGRPVINIEVSDDQANDRIDDALQYFIENHHEGATEQVISKVFTAGDAVRQTITLPDNVVAVADIYDPQLNANGEFSSDEFDRLNYLIAQSDFFQFSGKYGKEYDLLSYDLTMQYIKTMQTYFNRKRDFTFNMLTRELRVPSGKIVEGNYILLRCWVAVDPENSGQVWDSAWIKKYAKALIKLQWGENLKKYDGVQMVGGVTLNGQKIWDEANEEVSKLHEEFKLEFMRPYGPIWG